MSYEAHFLVARHAIPKSGEPGNDPGIDETKAQKALSGGAWATYSVMEDMGKSKLAIVTSPRRRAIETAIALAKTSDLNSLIAGEPIIEPELREEAFSNMNDYGTSLKWLPLLSRIVDTTSSFASPEDMTYLLITHEPVIKSIPYLRKPDTDYVRINEFSAPVVASQ